MFCCYPSFYSKGFFKVGLVPKMCWKDFFCWFVEMFWKKFSGIVAWDQWNGFLGGLKFFNLMGLMFPLFAASWGPYGQNMAVLFGYDRFTDVQKDLLLDQNRLRDLPEQVRTSQKKTEAEGSFGLKSSREFFFPKWFWFVWRGLLLAKSEVFICEPEPLKKTAKGWAEFFKMIFKKKIKNNFSVIF